MLGDCYTCAIVEHLSKQELMGYDVVNHSDKSTLTNSSTNARNNLVPELIVVSVENEKSSTEKIK